MIKSLFVIVTCLLTINIAGAQKLPNIQTVSLRVPTNVKIDGKATEWGEKFQAYNHATDLFYTISNDDKKVYLIIKAIDPAIIKRIINGSITFTIYRTSKKDSGNVSVTYPVFENNKRFYFIKPKISEESDTSKLTRVTDSLMNIINDNFHDKAKSIKLSGMKGIDSLISIYNVDGFAALGAFDNKFCYVYEMAISIKNLGILNNKQKFLYNIRINEVEEHGLKIKRDEASGKLLSISGTPGAQAGQYPTDFTGEYILKQ